MEGLRAYLADMEGGADFRAELEAYDALYSESVAAGEGAAAKIAELELAIEELTAELAKVKSHNYDLMRVAQLEGEAIADMAAGEIAEELAEDEMELTGDEAIEALFIEEELKEGE